MRLRCRAAGGLALLIGLAETWLSCCALGFGISSIDWVSSDSVAALRGVTTASDGRKRTDNIVALTDAPLLRDPTYGLSDRYFAVMHSLDQVLVFGRAGFGRARREFLWSLDSVGG